MWICAWSSVALFVGIIVCLRIGWVSGRKRLAETGEAGHAGLGAVDGAVFGLMGLLVAFTFTGAASRFNERRDLITRQVNAIGTAWMRLDLLEEPARQELRAELQHYVDTVIALGHHAGHPKEFAEFEAQLSRQQARIWQQATAAVRADKSLGMLLLPALNEIFDLSTSRFVTSRLHPPLAIYAMLAVLILVSALLAGFGMAKSPRLSRIHLLGVAFITALSLYLILDMEYPRRGLVRINSFDDVIVQLRESMK